MTTPFLGQVEMFGFGFAPKGWANCSGQLLSIQQNQALFALIGTFYGGNGVQTFGLPDLRSRVPLSQGTYSDGTVYVIGQTAGEENHTLQYNEMPVHVHTLNADNTAGATNTPATNTVPGVSSGTANPGGAFTVNVYSTANPNAALAAQSVGTAGGFIPHPNIMPYLCVNICMSLQGIFPSRN